MGSKPFDAVDRESGKKINALRREAKTVADQQEQALGELDLHMRGWSVLCGFCGSPIGECECYEG